MLCEAAPSCRGYLLLRLRMPTVARGARRGGRGCWSCRSPRRQGDQQGRSRSAGTPLFNARRCAPLNPARWSDAGRALMRGIGRRSMRSRSVACGGRRDRAASRFCHVDGWHQRGRYRRIRQSLTSCQFRRCSAKCSYSREVCDRSQFQDGLSRHQQIGTCPYRKFHPVGVGGRIV